MPPDPDDGPRDAPEPERPDLVEIEVGVDRFAAGALVARLEAAEIPVRLLTMDDHGLSMGIHRRMPHRLLVRKDDEDRVRRIIELTS